MIACSSRALNHAESPHAPTEGECLALVWETKKFKLYLHGYDFRVRREHAALQWLATARFENSKLYAGPCASKNSNMRSSIFQETRM